MQLNRSVSSYRERYKIKWQATVSGWMLNSTLLVEMVFHGYFAILKKIHFRIKFYFLAYLIHLPFYIFMSRGTLASLQTKTIAKFAEKWNLNTGNDNFETEKRKTQIKSDQYNFFFNAG